MERSVYIIFKKLFASWHTAKCPQSLKFQKKIIVLRKFTRNLFEKTQAFFKSLWTINFHIFVIFLLEILYSIRECQYMFVKYFAQIFSSSSTVLLWLQSSLIVHIMFIHKCIVIAISYCLLSCDLYVVPPRISAGNLQALQNDHWHACHALKNPLPPWLLLMKEIVDKENKGNVVMIHKSVRGNPPVLTSFYKQTYDRWLDI